MLFLWIGKMFGYGIYFAPKKLKIEIMFNIKKLKQKELDISTNL